MARTPTGLNSLKPLNLQSSKGPEIIPVRVKFVSLNGKDYPINWKEYGEYSSIGGILFEELSNPSGKSLSTLSFASPLYSNITFLPLVNEIVYIISLPNATTQTNPSTGKAYYYFQSINIWNSIHHNASPNSLATKPTQDQNYSKTEAGVEISSDALSLKVKPKLIFSVLASDDISTPASVLE